VRRSGFRTRTVIVDGSEKRVSAKLVPGSDRAAGKPSRGKGPAKGGDHSNEIVNPWGPGQ